MRRFNDIEYPYDPDSCAVWKPISDSIRSTSAQTNLRSGALHTLWAPPLNQLLRLGPGGKQPLGCGANQLSGNESGGIAIVATEHDVGHGAEFL
jgi:hypothetical protein